MMESEWGMWEKNSLNCTHDFHMDKFINVALNENKWMIKWQDIDIRRIWKGISKSRTWSNRNSVCYCTSKK